MFLSTENPPNDPLSSSPSTSSLLHLTTSSSSDELGQTHLQNFSIRDYAYSNRKNKIKNNWPFSPNSLQLCSAHGLTDPLPPFETTASSSSGKQIVTHVHRGSDFAKLGVKGGCSQSRIIIKNGFDRSASVSKSKVVETIVVAGTSNNNNKNNKKCGRGGLMVKSKEDTCGGGGGLVMTTTTCPICKTFSSASNTTLNAHIDQCLSADSELPPVITTKPNKPRVEQCLSVAPPVSSTKPNKPRAKALMKVKTMDDIYATAKGCTLEDLDKRNGTKWASVLSHTNQVVADKSEVLSKKRKASPVGVGPVYIDDKGQKLRILTEFSEKKTSSTTTQLREQYNEDGSKESSRSSRKARGGKKQYKYLKLTNLKASSTSEQINECQRVFSGEGSSTSHHRRIYNRRMLSKQKKLNEKEHKLYTLWDQPSEEEDEDDDDEWSGGERLVLRGTDSSPSNKQKLRREVSGRNKTMFGSKGAQSHSPRVQMSEKEEKSLARRAHLDTFQFKKRLASIQEDKYPLGKNVRELSPRATSMRKSSPPFVTNGWRRPSLPMVELKKARLDSSEEEESGKWESEMTQERELSSDDDSPSFSRYDDDEESSDEEEEDDDNNNNNNKRANVLDKSNDEEATPSNETIPTSERAMYYYSEQVEEMAYEEEDVRFDSEVRGKGSLFVEVDTIPIPGPPGSFLPSPRDMCFDENLGNSSVITSQFQSFDRNSSESPVSNFASDRLSFSAPSHHETSTIDKTEPPPRLENNDHDSCSCCCQRKERISEGIALNHQASHLLQRRAAAAYSSSAMNLTKSSPTRLDTNHSFEKSPYMIQQELDLHQSKFSNRAVVVPPSPNPVLRLMGKDLMVMNQVEEPHKEEASRESLKPTTKFLDPLPWGGTGLYFNTDLYLRNGFESTTHQLPTPKAQQPQDSPFRNSFDHVRRY